MAIKPANTTPHTESQRRYQQFWKQFNEYSALDETFCAEFKPHPYADVRYYQDYAVSMGPYHLCVCINFNKHECKTEAYFRDVDAWDIYHESYSDQIEGLIGGPLEWKRLQTKGSAALVRRVKFDKSRNWENAFKCLISDLLLLKQVFAKFYNKAEMRKYWIFPSNENEFRLHDFFRDNKYIDWQNKNKNNLNVGDIVLIYCSHPESTIRHITEVTRINVPVSEAIDDSAYSVNPPEPITYEYCTRLKHIREINLRELDFDILKHHGLKGSIMSPQKPNQRLLSYILSVLEGDNLDYEEIESPDELFEGAKKTMIVNQYERNPEARRQCIEAHGCYCHVCGLDFAERYGEIGEGFIHVHHIVPISTIGEGYVVDPIKDLIPVCPNCHAMLHRTFNGHLMSIEELQSALLSKTEYFEGRSDIHD